jgi:DNA-binding transcriptional ArsR family regulator
MNIDVTLSPQFDLCYALADIVSPAPHFSGWAGIEDSPEWIEQARSFGWVFWLGLSDMVEREEPAASIEEFISDLKAVPREEILPRLHRSFVDRPAGKMPSAEVREWLHFIGLDSGDPDPRWGSSRWEGPLDAPLSVLDAFRPHFEKAWKELLPKLRDSAEEVAEQARHFSLSTLASELKLGIEVERRTGMIRTLRGYKVPGSEVGTVYLMPSVFNSRRFITISDYASPRPFYFPYLLDQLKLPAGLKRTSNFGMTLDPWLVCRAIGDPTRAAILRLIAERPRASLEIHNELNLSKANVSHHIFQLRQAGLINEKRVGRTVELSIRLEPMRWLSQALTREFGRRGN